MLPARRCVFASPYLLHAALGAECALTLANGTKGAGKTEIKSFRKSWSNLVQNLVKTFSRQDESASVDMARDATAMYGYSAIDVVVRRCCIEKTTTRPQGQHIP